MATKSSHGIAGLVIASALAACGGPPPDATSPAEAPGAASAGLAAAPGATATPAERAPTGQMQPAADADTGLADLRQQVQLLRREVADLRGKVSRLPGVADTEPHQSDPRSDSVAMEQARQAERLRVASAETAFRNQADDPRWSQGAAASVRAALGQANDSMRNQVRSIECRAQSCRVEINAGPGDPAAQDLPLVIARLGQVLPNVTAGQVDQGDGRKATVLYMSR